VGSATLAPPSARQYRSSVTEPDETPAAMWAAYCAATETPVDTPHEVDGFGASPDELLALVLAGTKRATASLFAEYTGPDGDEPLVAPGHLWLVTDEAGRARCIVQTTEVRVGPMNTVDEQFAYDEGEGDRSLEYWTRVHSSYFRRRCAQLRVPWAKAIMVVFERFELVWPDRSRAKS
jgi:uncharacterized protein YhfF